MFYVSFDGRSFGNLPSTNYHHYASELAKYKENPFVVGSASPVNKKVSRDMKFHDIKLIFINIFYH